MVADEVTLEAFLDQLEHQMLQISTQLSELWFRRYVDKHGVTGIEELEAQRSHLLLDEGNRQVIESWASRAQQPLLQRRLHLWRERLLAAQVAARPEVVELERQIAEAIVAHPYEMNGRPTDLGTIRQILRREPDRQLREAAFRASSALSEKVAEPTRELMRRRNRLARELGYDSYTEFALRQQGLSKAQTVGILNDLQAASEPAYRRLLADGADRLGLREIAPWDVQYILETVGDLSMEPFPVSAIQPRLKAWAAAHGLDLEALGISVHFTDIPYNGLCMTITPRDVRILGNPGPGWTYHKTSFHELGHALHAARDGQGGYILRGSPSVFSEGMAETLAYVTHEPAWLNQVGVNPEKARAGYLGPWFHYLRQRSAYALFEYSAYDNPDGDHDRLLAETEARFLGCAVDQTPRWAANAWYASFPIYWQNYVLADVIASQIHAELHRRFGGLTGHPEAVQFLEQHFWAPGNTIDWQEKIHRATGKALSTEDLVADLR